MVQPARLNAEAWPVINPRVVVAQFGHVHRRAHLANFGKTNLRDGVEHPRIHFKSSSVDHLGIIWNRDIGAHGDNFPIANHHDAIFDWHARKGEHFAALNCISRGLRHLRPR
jgi:hypothetical protein